MALILPGGPPGVEPFSPRATAARRRADGRHPPGEEIFKYPAFDYRTDQLRFLASISPQRDSLIFLQLCHW
jgi:hypothetical protein